MAKDNKVRNVVIAGILFFLFMKKGKANSTTTSGGAIIPTAGTLPMYNNGYLPVMGMPGTIDESYLGIAANGRNRGIRNNNPGNFKMTSTAWNEKIDPSNNTDGTFQQYKSYPYGVRMMIIELKKNYIDAGHNTVDKLLNRYDPPGNPNYKTYVINRTGLTLNQTLTSNRDTLKKLVQAITRYENDQKQSTDPEVVLDQTFDVAYGLV